MPGESTIYHKWAICVESTSRSERIREGERMVTAILEPVERLDRDIKKALSEIGIEEARYLVDAYYSLQDYRKAAGNQVLALSKSGEPHSLVVWLNAQTETLEGQIRRALDGWTDGQPMGIWAKSITGIGPVISAGLLAHIDITRAPTAGHIWRFAGLDPTVSWEKKTKRPWNASLKVLCWKLGESFVKVCNKDKDVYGHLYQQRKEYEHARNEAGELAEQAALALTRKKIGKETDAYKAYIIGKLPPAHIHARAKRWAVKIFLSHYHAEAYRQYYGMEAPAPYPIAILGHAHRI